MFLYIRFNLCQLCTFIITPSLIIVTLRLAISDSSNLPKRNNNYAWCNDKCAKLEQIEMNV